MPIDSLHPDPVRPLRIRIEVQTRFQIPSFQILGLPSQEILEAKERIISAFESSQLEFPRRRVIINLRPPDLPKFGTYHDLAIAFAIMNAQNPCEQNFWLWGELGLDGTVESKGHAALWIDEALRTHDFVWIAHPFDADCVRNLLAWRIQQDLPVPEKFFWRSCERLQDLKFESSEIDLVQEAQGLKFETIKTQPALDLPPISALLKRWLLIALVGHHHWLILGPKGSGKSSALRWVEALSTPLDPALAWENLRFSENATLSKRPIRRVHAQIRPSHLLGHFSRGVFRPGALLESHGGIFIADEFPEWPRDSKECLREPLAENRIQLSRKEGNVDLPCKVQWIGTGNLCLCGGVPAHIPAPTHLQFCRCSEDSVRHYLSRMGGPVLDRIDLVTLSVGYTSADEKSSDSSELLLEKINRTQNVLRDRFGKLPGDFTAEDCEKIIRSNSEISTFLEKNALQSFRSRHKVLRVAHTIAALDSAPCYAPERRHLREAMGARAEGWI